MKSARELLRLHNLRSTPARCAIVQLLESAHKPVSVEYILSNMASPCNESTAYRVLEHLLSKGIAKTAIIEPGRMHYEFSHGRAHHHHIICTKCKDTENLHDCAVDALVPMITRKSKSFRIITAHTLEFFGICKKCQN